METRKIRDLMVLLPGEDVEDLDHADGMPKDKTTVAGRVIEADMWARTRTDGCTFTRCWFVDAGLSSIGCSNATFDRCVFRGTTLIGARLAETSLKNVIFENCRLDYATLTTVRATGPVAFLGCSMSETIFDRCKLTTVTFDGCKLNAPSFRNCDMRGADLRGNDLSRTIGVTSSLRGAILGEDQLTAFTDAVTRELELTIKPP